jgi:hypothetical protein
MTGPDATGDKAAIRELIESWVIWRDMGAWDRLRAIWHPEGRMAASWKEGTADEFIEGNRRGWDRGLDILHQLGGTVVMLSPSGDRALTLTKMVISQRADIHGTPCDVAAQARHFDRWEKRDGRWGLLDRRTIFDRDRLDPVEPGATVQLDEAVLSRFPVAYRHLAYLQSSLGYPVREDLPHLRGEAADALWDAGQEWLGEG